MEREQLEALMRINCECAGHITDGNKKKAFQTFSENISFIQNTLLKILDSGMVEQELILLLLSDMKDAMENRDSVLLADTLQYGVNALLEQIIEAVWGNINEQ